MLIDPKFNDFGVYQYDPVFSIQFVFTYKKAFVIIRI